MISPPSSCCARRALRGSRRVFESDVIIVAFYRHGLELQGEDDVRVGVPYLVRLRPPVVVRELEHQRIHVHSEDGVHGVGEVHLPTFFILILSA